MIFSKEKKEVTPGQSRKKESLDPRIKIEIVDAFESGKSSEEIKEKFITGKEDEKKLNDFLNSLKEKEDKKEEAYKGFLEDLEKIKQQEEKEAEKEKEKEKEPEEQALREVLYKDLDKLLKKSRSNIIETLQKEITSDKKKKLSKDVVNNLKLYLGVTPSEIRNLFSEKNRFIIYKLFEREGGFEQYPEIKRDLMKEKKLECKLKLDDLRKIVQMQAARHLSPEKSVGHLKNEEKIIKKLKDYLENSFPSGSDFYEYEKRALNILSVGDIIETHAEKWPFSEARDVIELNLISRLLEKDDEEAEEKIEEIARIIRGDAYSKQVKREEKDIEKIRRLPQSELEEIIISKPKKETHAPKTLRLLVERARAIRKGEEEKIPDELIDKLEEDFDLYNHKLKIKALTLSHRLWKEFDNKKLMNFFVEHKPVLLSKEKKS